MSIHSPVSTRRGFGGVNNSFGYNSSFGFHSESRDVGFLAKLNTLSRSRRRKQEAEKLDAEARQAMEDPLHPMTNDVELDSCQLGEGEERSMIEHSSKVGFFVD